MLKLVVVVFTLLFSTYAWSVTRSGPPPTFFDFVDNSELVVFGHIDQIRIQEFPEMEPPAVSVVELHNAHYIDGSGVQAFTSPIFLYSLGTRNNTKEDTRVMLFLHGLDSHPIPHHRFTINNDDSVWFSTQWDGRGIIQSISPEGGHRFRTRHHSCTVLNPLYEQKKYECKMGDRTIETFQPEDTEPPISVDSIIELISNHLEGKTTYRKSDFSRLYDPNLGMVLIQDQLAYYETIDSVLINMLETIPLQQKQLDGLNRRERARGNLGEYKNDPAIVAKYEELNEQQKARNKQERREREAKEEEEQARLAAEWTARRDAERAKEIERDGPPIRLIQAEASLSVDVSTLPQCSQLWHSPDMPLQGDDFYIGNCLQNQYQSVCTLVASSEEAGTMCTSLSEYVGGVITPPLKAYPSNGPWTSEALLVLYHGAGMTTQQLAAVPQPTDAPPLFIGATPTEWNLYLRQVPEVPITVPSEFK